MCVEVNKPNFIFYNCFEVLASTELLILMLKMTVCKLNRIEQYIVALNTNIKTKDANTTPCFKGLQKFLDNYYKSALIKIKKRIKKKVYAVASRKIV